MTFFAKCCVPFSSSFGLFCMFIFSPSASFLAKISTGCIKVSCFFYKQSLRFVSSQFFRCYVFVDVDLVSAYGKVGEHCTYVLVE